MNLRKYIKTKYSIRLKDFYNRHSLVFEIHYSNTWWYFEPKNMEMFDKDDFDTNTFVSGYIKLLEDCDIYEDIVKSIKTFYPLWRYVKRIGL